MLWPRPYHAFMSGLTKTPVLAEEGGNHSRKRPHPNNEQLCKRAKSDEMSANDKKSNFSLVTPNSNGTIKLNSSMNKPGATTKKLVIKNFKSVFTIFFRRHIIT